MTNEQFDSEYKKAMDEIFKSFRIEPSVVDSDSFQIEDLEPKAAPTLEVSEILRRAQKRYVK